MLYVLELFANLISTSALGKKGATTIFENGKASVSVNGKVLVRAKETADGLYVIEQQTKRSHGMAVTVRNLTMKEAHRTMGHLNSGDIKKLSEVTDGWDVSKEDLEECGICVISKQTRKVPKERHDKTSRVGEELSADLAFVNDEPVLLVSDTGSGCTIGKVLTEKGEAPQTIVEIVKLLETQYDVVVKKIISDGGGEFVNKRLENWAAKAGIKLVVTTPYSPEQNGIAERKNRTIMEMCRAMLVDSGLDRKRYWRYALEMAIYVRNRCPTRSKTDKRTPIELLSGKKPNLKHMRRFGEECYAYVDKHRRAKMDDKAVRAVVLGIEEKGYILLDKSGRIFRSSHVTFGYFEETSKANGEQNELDNSEECESEVESEGSERGRRPEQAVEQGQVIEQEEEQPRTTTGRSASRIPVSSRVIKALEPRDKVAPRDISSSIDMSNILESGRTRNRANMVQLDDEPKTNKEALGRSDRMKWKEAIMDELESLEENGTWKVIDKNEIQDEEANIVDTKWVHKIKRDADGKIVKYKSRLVAKGFTQVEGIDYNETFAPVVRMTTVRLLISICLMLGLKITQLDIVTAYLYSKIDKTIYMRVPEDYEFVEPKIDRRKQILKLQKGIYKLKQAG